MVEINKVYTCIGDQGSTDLAGAQRISKDSLRMQVTGDVDELNSMLGLTISAMLEPGLATLKDNTLN